MLSYCQAQIKDIYELTELRLAMRKERDNTFDENLLRKNTYSFFERNITNKTHIEFVCKDFDKIIATCGLSLFEMPPTDKVINGKVIKLMNMYVIPEHRKKGIATKLLEMAIDYAKENNYDKIMLNSSQMGKYLYEKTNFTLIKNEYELYIKKDDDIDIQN